MRAQSSQYGCIQLPFLYIYISRNFQILYRVFVSKTEGNSMTWHALPFLNINKNFDISKYFGVLCNLHPKLVSPRDNMLRQELKLWGKFIWLIWLFLVQPSKIARHLPTFVFLILFTPISQQRICMVLINQMTVKCLAHVLINWWAVVEGVKVIRKQWHFVGTTPALHVEVLTLKHRFAGT